MSSPKLSPADLYPFADIMEMLKTGITYSDFMAIPLPNNQLRMSNICRKLPYTINTSIQQRLQPVIIPVKEGCSLAPLHVTPAGSFLLHSDYTLYDAENTQQLLDHHLAKSEEITRLLTACKEICSAHSYPAPPPLFCTNGRRIAPVWSDHPNGGVGGYIICSVEADGKRSCRVSSGIWDTYDGAQAAIDGRCFPPREEGMRAICQFNIDCFAANTLHSDPTIPEEARPREYFG